MCCSSRPFTGPRHIPRLKSPVCLTIYPLQVEQHHPRFELRLLIPSPTMITILPWVPSIYLGRLHFWLILKALIISRQTLYMSITLVNVTFVTFDVFNYYLALIPERIMWDLFALDTKFFYVFIWYGFHRMIVFFPLALYTWRSL